MTGATRARVAVAATAATFTMLAAACGGGAGSATPDARGDNAGTPAPVSAAIGPAAGTGSTDGPSSGGGQFCDVVRSETAKLKSLVQRPGVSPNPAQLRVFYVAAVAADKRTAAVAPAEIKADADKSAEKAAAFATVLERADYDLSKLPADAGTDDDDGSVSRVDSYVKRVCGFDRTTG